MPYLPHVSQERVATESAPPSAAAYWLWKGDGCQVLSCEDGPHQIAVAAPDGRKFVLCRRSARQTSARPGGQHRPPPAIRQRPRRPQQVQSEGGYAANASRATRPADGPYLSYCHRCGPAETAAVGGTIGQPGSGVGRRAELPRDALGKSSENIAASPPPGGRHQQRPDRLRSERPLVQTFDAEVAIIRRRGSPKTSGISARASHRP